MVVATITWARLEVHSVQAYRSRERSTVACTTTLQQASTQACLSVSTTMAITHKRQVRTSRPASLACQWLTRTTTQLLQAMVGTGHNWNRTLCTCARTIIGQASTHLIERQAQEREAVATTFHRRTRVGETHDSTTIALQFHTWTRGRAWSTQPWPTTKNK